MTMHPHVQALFAEHETPTHAGKASTHDGLAPIHALVSNVRKQIIEYQLQIDAIERNDPPPSIIGELERLHQTLNAMEREAKVLMTAGRELARTETQFDRFMGEIKATIANAKSDP